MKILHIATDDKFLDSAYSVFEKVYPGKNEVFVIAAKLPLKYTKLEPDRVQIKRGSFFNKSPKISAEVYSRYDLIIFHSLAEATYPELKNIPSTIATVWLGWGYDYYKEFVNQLPLYLERTQKIYNELVAKKPKRIAANVIRAITYLFWPRGTKFQVIEKITIFAPVLPQEYHMVRNSRAWEYFPKFASWNYGTMEDDFVKGFEEASIAGNAILVGNSATYTGNHVEAFDIIRKLNLRDRKVVAPLSYGDPRLAARLTDVGHEYFSDRFEALRDFMPIEEYVATIKKCGYVIMNHIRQQAVGNIVIMLYLGARVFVREENPVYDFFKQFGVELSSVQDLVNQPELLNVPLTAEERAKNKKFVTDHWSRESTYERTRILVEKALAEKNGEFLSPLNEIEK